MSKLILTLSLSLSFPYQNFPFHHKHISVDAKVQSDNASKGYAYSQCH